MKMDPQIYFFNENGPKNLKIREIRTQKFTFGIKSTLKKWHIP